MPSKVEILDLLRVIAEQGLYHICSQEGYTERQGCDECKANNEAKLAALIGRMEAENGGQAGQGSP